MRHLFVYPCLFLLTLLTGINSLTAQKKAISQFREKDSIEALYKHQRNFKILTNRSANPSGSIGKKTESARILRPGVFSSLTSSVCPDTSERFFLKNDDYFFYVNFSSKTKSGDILIPAEYSNRNPPYKTGGALIKTSIDGTVQWTKLYDSANNIAFQYLYYYRVLELSDGSILLAGGTKNLVTENDDLVLTKITGTGDIIWSKTYNSRFWGYGNGSADYFYVQQIKEDPFSGDIFFTGPFWTAGNAIVRVNAGNGNIIWGKSYQTYGLFNTSFGFDIRQNELILFDRSISYSPIAYGIYRINKNNGDSIQTKFFHSIDPAGTKVDILSPEELVKLDNGNYVISGRSYGNYEYLWNGINPLYQASVIEFDSSLNFVRAYNLRNAVESNSYNTKITVHPDGSGLLSMLKVFSGYTADAYLVQFANGQILKQRKRSYLGEGLPVENNSIRLPDGGDMVIKLLGDSATNLGKIEFLKLHTSDTSSICIGTDDFSTFIYPFRLSASSFGLDSVRVDPFRESLNKTISVTDKTLTKDPGCFIVSYCDTLNLSTPDNTICLSDSLILKIHKNKACGTIVPINFDTSVVSSAFYINDTTVQFKFKTPWTGYISAALQGCTLLKDSVLITVLQTPASLSLGADTALCPLNTIVLNAKSGYVNYSWQNGSTDSIYTVTQPGIYYVTTEDACNNSYSDTIVVTQAPPVSLNLGPDKTKCNNDTLHLNAPSGFINYSWGPDYNISSAVMQNIIINPSVDTSYYIKAEKTLGCFGFDTIEINVNTSPAINLGNDTSFCSGQSVILSSGNGFNSYLWSNNDAGSQLTVNSKGLYSVIGTTLQGCRSYDTLQVLNVFINPVVQLNKDTGLCAGTSKILDAGNFTSYLWNNGSTGKSVTVNTTGLYSVTVTDQNGCKGIDSSSITVMYPSPSFFLPSDTAICSYGKLDLKAASSFETYLWSSNQTSPAITISKPGTYWLQVKDSNNCLGTDSILVNLKQCMTGFFIPTAFTPDGNQLNDDIKPFVFGNVLKYEFTIFNRWGQIIFQTSDLLKGWDGTLKGYQQDSGTYSWVCRYQLDGEKPQIQKGTFILIR
ncbi:MAG: gliding motility-associated C-terminal domain-containing protein [Lacibacter sp.]